MSPRIPPLGSLAVQSPPQTSQLVHVSPSTCHNLSLFKELLREYRKLDDSVMMRINRTNAQFRDRDRLLGASGKGNVQEEACAHLWQELVDNWKRRGQIIDYCVKVMEEARVGEQPESDHSGNGTHQRESEVAKYQQVRNELTIERVVRRRTIDAFISRCRYFEPPKVDHEARRWWDEAQKRH
ncbi:caffeine-induced death protein 2-domain-containing protein [Lactifluus volemus]|nr:caffeine-induced death protein 2-domain-containing protein [Lactifluus volemus]